MADSPQTLLTALLAVQKELPSISLKKDSVGKVQGINKAGKTYTYDYNYLDLAGLHAAILPLLNKHGLVWTALPEQDATGPILRYRISHVPSEEAIIGAMPLMLDKQNSQGLGSAITYARRYSLLSVIGAVGDEDDDGQKASEAGPVTKKVFRDTDRTLNDEERALVVDAMKDAKNKDMLLRSVGCDDLGALTVGQGRAILAKVVPPEASAK